MLQVHLQDFQRKLLLKYSMPVSQLAKREDDPCRNKELEKAQEYGLDKIFKLEGDMLTVNERNDHLANTLYIETACLTDNDEHYKMVEDLAVLFDTFYENHKELPVTFH